ncbi:hypothetical protein C5B42_05910 [Candidatus Cerribacteria bacterium 'Amazon FNV 2010 28 9']|uniref:Triosephosphate isomerase n=1 Tax=Candidatus Cerribacteria bacterium 'Amazon FNV 2010 28 9' TaxID=2081795 RepID=A0A317JMH7_9BACT|nr:MAG: hypothetical protein C5B42_05910 [Candidatus Cerribacteria bacterium 'Amazon FNV 2010 28 9']
MTTLKIKFMSKLIIANFKSNKNREEYEQWVDIFERGVQKVGEHVAIVLAPPLVNLMFFSNRLMGKKTHPHTSLGVQDISPFPAGSYTGAVGTRNLDGFDVRYAIIGHSERRKYFKETNIDIANKVQEALAAKITPIVCVTKDECAATANAIESSDRKKCVVAFEPIEHIGTGTADTLEDIVKTKEWVTTAFGNVPYIYGGSVSASTDTAILTHASIDGFLVGHACLDPHEFLSLLRQIR